MPPLETRLRVLRTVYLVVVLFAGVWLLVHRQLVPAAVVLFFGAVKLVPWLRPVLAARAALGEIWAEHRGVAFRCELPPGWSVDEDTARALEVRGPGGSLHVVRVDGLLGPEEARQAYLTGFRKKGLRDERPASGRLFGLDAVGVSGSFRSSDGAFEAAVLSVALSGRTVVVSTFRDLDVPPELFSRLCDSLRG